MLDLRQNNLVTKAAVMDLKELCPFIRRTKRPVEDMFNKPGLAKAGESYTIRRPVRGVIRRGDAMQPQNIVDEGVTLTMDSLWGYDVELTDREWKMNLNDFRREVTRPAMLQIAAQMEAYYFEKAILATANSVGTPGTAVTNDLTILTARDLLVEHGAPREELDLFIDTRTQSALVNANKTLFHERKAIASQYRTGLYSGMAHDFNWFTTTSSPEFTTGAYGTSTPLIKGASQSGSTLAIDGWESGESTINEGDVFYIDGVFAVHPQNRISTGQLQAFVVTAQTSDSSGETATLPISPAIKGPGDPHQNVSALPADNAKVFFQGSTTADPDQNPSTGSIQALGRHPEAFCLAFVPLPKHEDAAINQRSTDPDTKISVRFWQASDIRSGSNLARFDVFAGFAAPYPELAVRVFGA